MTNPIEVFYKDFSEYLKDKESSELKGFSEFITKQKEKKNLDSSYDSDSLFNLEYTSDRNGIDFYKPNKQGHTKNLENFYIRYYPTRRAKYCEKGKTYLGLYVTNDDLRKEIIGKIKKKKEELEENNDPSWSSKQPEYHDDWRGAVLWNLENDLELCEIKDFASLFSSPGKTLEKNRIFERIIAFFKLLVEAGIFSEKDSKNTKSKNDIRQSKSHEEEIESPDKTNDIKEIPLKSIPERTYNVNVKSSIEVQEPVLFWVTTVKELFERDPIESQNDITFKPGNYCIPDYQRGYAWNSRQIDQLCMDLLHRSESTSAYHLGTLIFHRDKENFNVVDGQQRLTTISWLLGQELFGKGNSSEQQFTKVDKERIIEVFQNYNEKDRSKIKNTLEQCTFVCIAVTELEESFQLFSTQNGRGLSLTPVNLLKAYHFHEIKEFNDSLTDSHASLECIEEKQNELDEKWEKFNAERLGHGDGKILQQVIGEHLYRLRSWCRGEFPDKAFSNDDISEFKGLTPCTKSLIPLQNLAVLRQHASNTDSMFVPRVQGDDMDPYVSINQPIINGKDFFDYALSYAKAYKLLFVDHKISDFKSFYQERCIYKGSGRRGDTYARHVFESLCLFCFDRFGSKGLTRCQQVLYCCAYFERLIKTRCYYQTCGAEFAVKAVRCMLRSMTVDALWDYLHDLDLEIKKQVKGRKPSELPVGIKDSVEPVFKPGN